MKYFIDRADHAPAYLQLYRQLRSDIAHEVYPAGSRLPSKRLLSEELGLSGYFDAVCGSNRDSTRKDKRDLIPYAVETLGGSRDDLSEAVMLGDTWYDAKGAKECGVDFIACRYGYGNNDDMEKYDPVARAESTEEIADILLR